MFSVFFEGIYRPTIQLLMPVRPPWLQKMWQLAPIQIQLDPEKGLSKAAALVQCTRQPMPIRDLQRTER